MNDIRRIENMGRMSNAVVHGGTVYLSGQVAIDNRGKSAELQVEEVLSRIDALLTEAGSDRSRMLSAQIFVADLAILPTLNAAWDQWLPQGAAPTRTTIQVVLASPAYQLEIAVTAAL